MSWDILTYEEIKCMPRIDSINSGKGEAKHTVVKVYTL